jgi:hypothetical protein
MMRIAKIAGDDGAGDAGAAPSGAGAAPSGSLALVVGGSLRGRGAGGSLRGRGGVSCGRGATDTDFGSLDEANAGSEPGRGTAEFGPVSSGESAGFERRFGIGGGWLSGVVDGIVGRLGGSGASTSACAGPSFGSPSAEKEIVGAIGALSALEEAKMSTPSPGGRAEGGLEAMFESRFGLGGGASLRDIGGAESCALARCPVSITGALGAATRGVSISESEERSALDEPDAASG